MWHVQMRECICLLFDVDVVFAPFYSINSYNQECSVFFSRLSKLKLSAKFQASLVLALNILF